MAADTDIYSVLLDLKEDIGELKSAGKQQSERFDTVVKEMRAESAAGCQVARDCRDDIKELDHKLGTMDTKVGRVTIAVVALLVTVFGAEKLVSMFMR